MADYHMKRQRGRGRKPGGGGGGGGSYHNNNQHQNPNRSMESSGPEGGKVRGPASLIFERYLQLARDATSSGDRVLGENYLQHADHYFRLVRSAQPASQPQQQQQHQNQPNDRFSSGAEQDFEGDEEIAGGEAESGADAQVGGADTDQPEGEQPQQGGEGGNRRRGRRTRFRPEGERDGPSREGAAEGAEAAPRQEQRPERERRPPREQRESDSPEGFAVGPKPAFLRGD